MTPAEAFAFGRQLDEATAKGQPANELMRYARLVRPFPLRAMSDALYHVNACGSVLNHLHNNALLAQPTTADLWFETLEHMLDVLDDMAERIDEAKTKLIDIQDRADVDEARGISAVQAIMHGLVQMGEIEQPPMPADEDERSFAKDPEPCPRCDGSGSDGEGGACLLCQGSAIDPDDPASPL
jgi:hypothetical protein